jgi:hypothetical protein
MGGLRGQVNEGGLPSGVSGVVVSAIGEGDGMGWGGFRDAAKRGGG